MSYLAFGGESGVVIQGVKLKLKQKSGTADVRSEGRMGRYGICASYLVGRIVWKAVANLEYGAEGSPNVISVSFGCTAAICSLDVIHEFEHYL
jgi:hypothetical protein